MRRAVTSILIGGLFWTASAAAQCIAPLSELQSQIKTAEKKLQTITRDKTKAAEPAVLIARLETERQLRGARQAFNEALQNYRTQGKALVLAAERASRGQVTPSTTDALACEQGECERISSVEHAAMITIGAVAETGNPATWPSAERSCDFTLFGGDTAGKALWRGVATQQPAAQEHIAYWSEIGYAVITATLRMERGRAKNASELETAALAVMGAHPARKPKACLLERTPARNTTAVFAPVPAPQC